MARTSTSTEVRVLRVGIIDLMTGAAGTAAKRQFSAMLGPAAEEAGVSLDISSVTVGPGDRGRIRWNELGDHDALIVTGAEPRADEMANEPAFGIVERILAEAPAESIMFSCFAAHAALRVLYAIDRVRLPAKRCGVFQHRPTTAGHPLVKGVASSAVAPHSRWNLVPRDRLDGAGVTTLLELEADDWHMACSGDGLRFLFFQGHPEYETSTLFREYRRDVRRFLDRGSDRYPDLPVGYFDAETLRHLTRFREQVLASPKPSWEAFPDECIVIKPHSSWEREARVVIRNWLAALATERSGCR